MLKFVIDKQIVWIIKYFNEILLPGVDQTSEKYTRNPGGPSNSVTFLIHERVVKKVPYSLCENPIQRQQILYYLLEIQSILVNCFQWNSLSSRSMILLQPF